jgi:hypothetical protein
VLGYSSPMRSTLKAAAATVALALTLAACGGSSSTGSSSAAKLVATASQALRSASSVQIAAVFPQGNYELELTHSGGRGQLLENGSDEQWITLGATGYVRANAAFWDRYASAAVAAQLIDKWVQLHPGSGLTQIRGYDEIGFWADAFGGRPGESDDVSEGGTAKIFGQPATVLNSTQAGYPGKYYISSSGTHYPLYLQGRGIKVAFSRYNAPLSLVAPADAIVEPPTL